mmetsp:Transcript_31933/g.44533  ORF Transcript_31933/g.44533 Transcript_31933/m.44533 type:complete len:214 (-) Transcript_31933:192-833(-)
MSDNNIKVNKINEKDPLGENVIKTADDQSDTTLARRKDVIIKKNRDTSERNLLKRPKKSRMVAEMKEMVNFHVRMVAAEIRHEVETYRAEMRKELEWARVDIESSSKGAEIQVKDLRRRILHVQETTAPAKSWEEIIERQTNMMNTLKKMKIRIEAIESKLENVGAKSAMLPEMQNRIETTFGPTISMLLNYFFEGLMVIAGAIMQLINLALG